MPRPTSPEWERSSERGSVRPGEGEPFPSRADPHPVPLPSGREDAHQPARLDVGPRAYALLTGCAGRRSRITYADFAFTLGLGSPRALGWLLSPLLAWCGELGLPPLPIIVVRRADGLPSGGYDPRTIEAETARVFDHPWAAVVAPTAAELARHISPRLPAALRGAPHLAGASPC